MAKYLYLASYTTEGLKGLLKDGGSKRKEDLGAAVKESIKYALLIGGGLCEFYNFNTFYKNIEYVANSLKQLGYNDDNVKILFYGGRSSNYPLIEEDVTRSNVIAELMFYERIIDPNDSLLIFRSGHGTIELVDEK